MGVVLVYTQTATFATIIATFCYGFSKERPFLSRPHARNQDELKHPEISLSIKILQYIEYKYSGYFKMPCQRFTDRALL